VLRTLSDGRRAGGVILQPTPDRDGYLRVSLRNRRVGVHQAVALAFHGPPEVRHLNGDHRDNKPGNLAWGSHRENERDKRKQKKEENIRSRPSELGTDSRTFETRLVSLSEATSQGYLSCSLVAARKASQRDPDFPAPAATDGLAHLYDTGQLLAWDQSR
jgi:HNH endonuclease